MKTFFSAAALVAMTATSSLAQAYTDPVTANGVNYLCQPGSEEVDGQTIRRCIRDDDDGGVPLFSGGTSSGTAIAIGAGVILLAAALASDDDDDDANGTQ